MQLLLFLHYNNMVCRLKECVHEHMYTNCLYSTCWDVLCHRRISTLICSLLIAKKDLHLHIPKRKTLYCSLKACVKNQREKVQLGPRFRCWKAMPYIVWPMVYSAYSFRRCIGSYLTLSQPRAQSGAHQGVACSSVVHPSYVGEAYRAEGRAFHKGQDPFHKGEVPVEESRIDMLTSR